MSSAKFPRRSIALAPFGRHTRYVFLSYIRHALVIASALLSVAFAVDLTPQVAKALGTLSGFPAIEKILWLALLRAGDLLPRFIPLASFLGVLWTEIVLTLSRERILIWNTGRSPFHCLVPAILLSIVLGALQFVGDAYVRPAAAAIQVEQHLGTLADTFDRSLSPKQYWIAAGDDLLLSRLEYSTPPVLHDLTLYRLDKNGRLREVDNASSAIPGKTEDSWILRDGSYWAIPPESATGSAAVPLLTRGTKASAIKFSERPVDLRLAPVMVSETGIYLEYLPPRLLAALASAAAKSGGNTSYMARLDYIYGNAAMPGAMALLAAALCFLFFSYGAPLGVQLAMLPAGYAGHLAMKTFYLMGEHEYLSPMWAAWSAPVAITLVSGMLLAVIQYRRRR